MTPSPTSTAVAKRDGTPAALIEQYKGDFSTVLPSHIKPEQWLRVASGVCGRNPQLVKVAKANPRSFLAALLDCARYGLEPGDSYHLVPFGNDIVGIRDWKGEVELIFRAGAVTSVVAEIVYSGDHFRFNPKEMDRPDHEPDWFGDRGEMIGVYAYAVMVGGGTSRVVILSKDHIAKVMKESKTSGSSSSPWRKWPESMWLKTAVHQLHKWVPSSPEYRDQVARSTAALETTAAVRTLGVVADQADYDGDADETPLGVTADGEIVDAEVVDDPEPVTANQLKALHSLLGRVHPDVTSDADRHTLLSAMIGREIGSASDLTKPEASTLIDHLNGEADKANGEVGFA